MPGSSPTPSAAPPGRRRRSAAASVFRAHAPLLGTYAPTDDRGSTARSAPGHRRARRAGPRAGRPGRLRMVPRRPQGDPVPAPTRAPTRSTSASRPTSPVAAMRITSAAAAAASPRFGDRSARYSRTSSSSPRSRGARARASRTSAATASTTPASNASPTGCAGISGSQSHHTRLRSRSSGADRARAAAAQPDRVAQPPRKGAQGASQALRRRGPPNAQQGVGGSGRQT